MKTFSTSENQEGNNENDNIDQGEDTQQIKRTSFIKTPKRTLQKKIGKTL